MAELPFPGLVRVQPGNSKNNTVCGEGFESLTPLHKPKETLWSGKPVVRTELLAGNMAQLFTSSRLVAVMLKTNIWLAQATVFMWVDTL
jgi:hypothetical protein